LTALSNFNTGFANQDLKIESFMKNKKWFCFAAAIAFLLVNKFSYAQKENEINKKLVQVWFMHLASHDTVALAAMYTDTALIESPTWEGTKKGPSAIREMYSRYFTSSPDLAHSMIQVFTNDKTVVIEYSFSGTMTNLEGTSPEYMRGKKYTLKACTRMNIENGKIAGQAYYFDQVAFLRQVGFFDQK
jgi:steroid delta-isomerase-like uncharacterized protein